MLSLFYLLSNSLFIYFFRKWIGPVGLFVFSFLVLLSSLIMILILYFNFIISSSTLFIDFGRFLYSYEFFDLGISFAADHLSLITSILVIMLTIFAQFFGIEYMNGEAFITRLLYLLLLFSTSVVFLFFVHDFFLILIVWELIGLFSLLLVNFYSIRIYTIKAAFKTYVFSRLSDFFIFIAFFIIIIVVGSTDLANLFVNAPFLLFYNIYFFNLGFSLLNLLAVAVVWAGAIKAAQFPFHVWLPDAMEAPTPASALIHSSTLVIMGIYLIIRLGLIFELTYFANILLLFFGGFTIAVGAISASFQNDIKKLVAYSTVSQMGYLFCGCGFLAYPEVIYYLAVHAMNKAFLFILVGYIVHFFNGNTDLRFMGGLLQFSPFILFLSITISLNLSGLPLTSGFIAKEFLVFQTLRGDAFSYVIRVLWFFSFFFTNFYMLFLNWFVFFRAKQNFTKLYIHSKPVVASLSPLSLLDIRASLGFSPLLSQLSVFFFMLLFVVIISAGEFLLLNVFGFLNISNLPTLNNFFSFNYFFFSRRSFFQSLWGICFRF